MVHGLKVGPNPISTPSPDVEMDVDAPEAEDGY